MSLLTNATIGTLVAQFFLAAAGTLSFAILFACPRRLLPYCALVGGAGWLVYELAVLLGADSTTASLLAVIPLTLLTRVLAILLNELRRLLFNRIDGALAALIMKPVNACTPALINGYRRAHDGMVQFLRKK